MTDMVTIFLGTSRIGIPMEELAKALKAYVPGSFRNHFEEIKALTALREANNSFQAAVEKAISPTGSEVFPKLCLMRFIPEELSGIASEIDAILADVAARMNIKFLPK